MPSSHCTAVAVLLLTMTLLADSGLGASNDCGTVDISQPYGKATIKFVHYCQKRIMNGGALASIPAAQDFQRCAHACTEQGTSCGGFALSRDGFGRQSPTCYLIQAPVAPWQTGTANDDQWFDSALVDNSTIPEMKPDSCGDSRETIYNGFQLNCSRALRDNWPGGSSYGTFAATIQDCVDACKNFDRDGPCQAISFNRDLIHGIANCHFWGNGYPFPVSDDYTDVATMLGTTGKLPNPPYPLDTGPSTTSASNTATVSSTSPSTARASSTSSSTSSTSSASTESVAPWWTLPTSSSSPSPSLSSSANNQTDLAAVGVAGLVISVIAEFTALTTIFFLYRTRRRRQRDRERSRGLTVRDEIDTVSDEAAAKNMTTSHEGELEAARRGPPPDYADRDVNAITPARAVVRGSS